MTEKRAEQILDIAEREMRRGGLDAISFRDIAAAIGIKSASVHYHFPTKADLSEAVVERYTERFMARLGSPQDPADTSAGRILRLADAYLIAYLQEGSTCLCAVLGSVVSHVPNQTSEKIGFFYASLLEWIKTAMSGTEPSLTANLIISTLQGSMVLAIATNDKTPLVEARVFLAQQLQD